MLPQYERKKTSKPAGRAGSETDELANCKGLSSSFARPFEGVPQAVGASLDQMLTYRDVDDAAKTRTGRRRLAVDAIVRVATRDEAVRVIVPETAVRLRVPIGSEEDVRV